MDKNTSVALRSKKKTQTSALTKYLFDIGATKDEVDKINSSMMAMLEKADIKQEDMTDIIQLLRKFEIKFLDLCEFREREITQGSQEKVDEILSIELAEAQKRKEDRQQRKKDDDLMKEQAKRLKMEEKTKKRSEALRVSGRRDNGRSDKP